MTEIEADGGTKIARSIEDVFDYLSDPRNEPKWLPGVQARMLASPRGVMRLVAPLMARTMRRQFAANWDHLRRAMEAPPAGAPAAGEPE